MNSNIIQEKNNQESTIEPESALDILLALLYAKGINGQIGEPIEGITRKYFIKYKEIV